jgi:hypothetical protein
VCGPVVGALVVFAQLAELSEGIGGERPIGVLPAGAGGGRGEEGLHGFEHGIEFDGVHGARVAGGWWRGKGEMAVPERVARGEGLL